MLSVAAAPGAAAAPAAPAAPAATPTPKALSLDLAVAVTGTVAGRAGQSVPVTVTWRNAGTTPAVGVSVSYLPPLGAELGGLPAGWTKAGRSAVRTEAGMARGVSRSATLTVTIGAAAKPGLLVGGAAEVRPGVGVDSKPGNNQATSRIRVQAGPSPSPSRTPTPTRTPSPTAKVTTPSVTPTRAAPTTSRGAVAAPASTRTAREPALAPSTFVVPARTTSPKPEVVQVIDSGGGTTAAWLLPTVGAIACFTSAGLVGMTLRRRRAAERAHADEVRHLQQVL